MNIDAYLKYMAQKGASDLFLTTGAPACIKQNGEVVPASKNILLPGTIRELAYTLMDAEQRREFENMHEMNLGLSMPEVGRFRVNIYKQRGEVSMVVRYISSKVPTLDGLNAPSTLKTLVANKSGLVLVVGATGTGKSTTLAAMIDYRSRAKTGHILTVEDPIEFTFSHKKSIVGQREIGIDTLSYENALREAMREAPDVIMIGEIRDRETMKAALAFADTGHLVLSTLHAINANQALDRVLNFFPSDTHSQILMDLSMNLRGIISQRLVPAVDKTRVAAMEILLNTPYISDMIQKGEVSDIKEVMEKAETSGMQTFDQALYRLYKEGRISLEEALSNADSRNNLEWRINYGAAPSSEKPKEGSEKAERSDLADSALDDLMPVSSSLLDHE